MEKKIKSRIFLRIAFLLIAVLFVYLMWWFIKPIDRHIFNPGNLVGIAGCGFIALCCILFRRVAFLLKAIWKRSVGKIILIILSVFLLVCIITASIFSFLMVSAISNEPKSSKLIVVLGCKLHGSTPSEMLYRRLEAAEQYLKDNKDAICITSGGQGSDEDIPEGVAMKDYLVSKGIDEKRIFIEDKSKNTYENIKFSKEILDKVSPTNEIAIATDGFHQYRAGFIAKELGLKGYAVNAKTNPDYVPTFWVREWFGIAKDLLFFAF